MRAVYTGHETLTFPDYLDLESGKTLTAVPGRVYDVSPAGGGPVPEVPPGWFTSFYDSSSGGGAEFPEVVAEPEPEPEPEDAPEDAAADAVAEPVLESGTEPQQF